MVFSVLRQVPFSQRTWALPVLFRLHCNLEECKKKWSCLQEENRVGVRDDRRVLSMTGGCRVEVAADAAYCNDTITRGFPDHVLFGAMRPDAVLTAWPDPRSPRLGRPCKRGRTLPKPEAFATDGRRPWKEVNLTSTGGQGPSGTRPPTPSGIALADRSGARRHRASLLYSVLVIGSWKALTRAPSPSRLFDPGMPISAVTFEDILRTARVALFGLDVLDPASHIKNLHKLRLRSQKQRPPRRRQPHDGERRV
jgi:hypothetical protein